VLKKDIALAVLFCGGCRPTYDRTAWLEALITRLRREVQPEVHFPPDAENISGNAVRLYICGCRARCPSIPDGFHVITSPFEMDGRSMTQEEMIRQFMDEVCACR
jgi:hypothetical protein